jgi:hypothetical protein
MPFDVALNVIIQTAIEKGFDVVFILSPAVRHPDGFIRAAFMKLYDEHFIEKQPVAAIAAPACGPRGLNVFKQIVEYGQPARLEQYEVDDCTDAEGFESVPAVGAECVAFAVDCFKQLVPPYFRFELDATGTQVLQDPGTYCTARLVATGHRVLVDWDHWCDVFATVRHGRPE